MNPAAKLFLVFANLCSCTCHAGTDKATQADILALALPASAYLLTLHKQDNDGSWALTKSLGLTALSTIGVNSIIEKDAPNGSSSDAFPSGHTSIAFSSAAFIQQRYGWRSSLPAYLVASYVGHLRIETDDHDAADVIGGAALGIISSYLLTRPFNDKLKIAAWADGKSGGLQFQVQW